MTRFFSAILFALSIPFTAQAAVDIQDVTSPGGFNAWLVEEHSLPFVALEISFQGGASLDAEGKRGAIHLMTGLLEEGSGDLNAVGFAKAQQDLAAEFSFDVHDDSLTIGAKFLTENRDEAMALLRGVLVDPRFDPDAIERVRGQVQSIIRSEATDPNDIARNTFNALAFGGHPYATSRNGTEDSVAALTREDLFDAHARVIAKDRIYVAAVGDITAEELGALLDTLLGDIPDEGAAPLPDASYGLTGGVTIVPLETPQSVALFGHQGFARDDPDFFAAFILNEFLGGRGLGSRLMEEVREKRGLTYGVYSYLVPKDHAELILGQVASANDRIAEAISVIRDEWARIAEQGLTEDELHDVKRYLTGAYPLRFDGNARIAGIMVGMQMTGLPIDYIATRNDKVNAVTVEDIRRVAARLYQSEDLHFVVVGAPEDLEATN